MLTIVVLLFHPLVLPAIAHYALHDSDIRYSKLSGTLYSGFRIDDVSYKHLFKAQEAELNFDLWHLWRHGLNVDVLRLRNAVIDLNALPQQNEHNANTLTLPSISLKHLVLQNITLISGSETIGIEGSFKNSRYDNGIVDTEHIDATIATRYATAILQGSMEHNVFSGTSSTRLDKSYFQPYLEAFQTIPLHYNLNILYASSTRLQATATIPHLQYGEGNISIYNAAVNVDYNYSNPYIDVNGSYLLRHKETAISVAQQLRIDFDGNLTSTMAIHVDQTPYTLPERDYNATIALTSEGSLYAELHSDTQALHTTVSSSDMQTFALHAQATEVSGDFIDSLPPLLQHRDINASIDANISINTTVTAHGTVTLGDHTGMLQSTFEYDGAQLLAQGRIDADHHAAEWNGISTHNIFPISFVAHYNRADEGMLALRSHEVYVTLFKRAERLNGWGSYKSSRFDIEGVHHTTRTVLHVNNHIASLYELINSIRPLHYNKFEYYDAELDARTTVTIDDDISVESELKIPWYVAQQDSQTINFGHNSTMKVRLFNRYITLDEYNVSLLGHRVYANRDSKFFLDAAHNLHVNSLWIYDTLQLTGLYESQSGQMDMRLYGKAFHYKGPEGDLRAAVDIALLSDGAGNLSVEGSVNVLEGEVTYYPSKSYLMRDDDIIIIQDVREPQSSDLFINVHITAEHPLRYNAHDIHATIVPDITLWKEPNGALVILGMATIESGEARLSDKRYEISQSKVYFGGDIPINPYLDLNILREIDYKKIHIYVTNTMEDPVVLFSATPSMSQNDIMSYLIFGTPANSAFEGGEELSGASAANLILGMGLKKMIGDTTGIHVDTLNILSSESGALGFEVGTQVSEKLRILLKNDAKFSAVIQYKLNRWLRIDVDVKETGQGINLIYVKDLRDPFRQHSITEKP